MKKLLFLLLLSILPVASHAERGVIGAQSYDSPLGCAPDSVFNLIAGSVINTYADAALVPGTNHSFNILPDYNNGQGAAFQLVTHSANMYMASSGLSPLSYFGSMQFGTANNPVSNSYATISVTSTSKVFLHSTNQSVGGCVSNPCLHNFVFSTSGAGPGVDTSFITAAPAGQGIGGGVTDGQYLFFLHPTYVPLNTTELWQFDESGTTTINFINIGTGASSREMIQDQTYLYFRSGTSNNVRRVMKDGLSTVTFTLPFGAPLDNITQSTSQQAFYMATGGGVALTIHRLINDFSTSTHNVNFGAEQLTPYGLVMDEKAQKLYVVSEPVGDTVKKIRRLNPSTLAVEQTLSINLGTAGFVAAPDFTHKYLWISDIGNPSHIQRIQLCT